MAANMKEQRRIRGLSQAKLAEKVNTSIHYIGMIEIERKFPSPEMLERIAGALGIDSPELFSMKAFPLEYTILPDLTPPYLLLTKIPISPILA